MSQLNSLGLKRVKKGQPREPQPDGQDSSRKFTYSKLERKGLIRLLRLHAGPQWDQGLPERKGSLSCSLISVDISQPPLYTALSYTWEKGPADSAISLDKKPFFVHASVFDLLQSLRISSGSRLLWIDAICINQLDISERNEQVRLMGEIYSKANYVISWLYDPSATMAIALEMMEGLASSSPSIQLSTEDNYANIWLEWFFTHPYWTRRWILQEVTLARSVILKLGPAELPMNMVGRCFDVASQSAELQLLRWTQKSMLRFYPGSVVGQLYELRQSKPSATTTLRDLLSTYRRNECSEVRDRVFSLLSLSAKAKTIIAVDYAISTSDLLQQVLDFSIDFEGMNPAEVVGLVVLLRELQLPDINSLQQDGKYLVSCLSRGNISSLDLDPLQETRVMRARNSLPSLRAFKYVTLERRDELETLSGDLALLEAFRSDEKWMTSSHDLCSFCFEEDGQTYVGMASSWVETGDQIWQFHDTNVALVSRPEKGGFRLIARAFILSDHNATERDTDHDKIVERFVLEDVSPKSPQLQFGRKRSLSVSFQGLMALAAWADESI